MTYKTLPIRILAVLVAALIAGCATNGSPRVGSKSWHAGRVAEVEAAYQAGELTTEEYLNLKNEADVVRNEYKRDRARRYYNPPFSFHFGVVHFIH